MDASIHRMAAEAWAGQGGHLRAAEEYEFAVKLEPNDGALRFALADTYLQLQQTDDARRVLGELLEQQPDYPGAKGLWENLAP